MAAPTITRDDTSAELDIGYAGGTLAGAGAAQASYRVEIGDPEVAYQDFEYAGLHGVFRQMHGTRARGIRISGSIRCSLAAWQAILAARDAFRQADTTLTVDCDEGTFANCSLAGFKLSNKTRIQPIGSMIYRVEYVIEFEQLEV